MSANIIDIKKASTKELLDYFNANSGREPVARFSDRATAEKRVRFLLDRPTGNGDDTAVVAEEPAKKAKPAKAKTTKAAKPAKESKPKEQKAPRTPVDPTESHAKRAASISKSWTDETTREARSARNGCKVSGEVYPSVPMAFIALKLDMKKCQRVRRDMVLNGNTTYEGYRFTLVRE